MGTKQSGLAAFVADDARLAGTRPRQRARPPSTVRVSGRPHVVPTAPAPSELLIPRQAPKARPRFRA